MKPKIKPEMQPEMEPEMEPEMQPEMLPRTTKMSLPEIKPKMHPQKNICFPITPTVKTIGREIGRGFGQCIFETQHCLHMESILRASPSHTCNEFKG